MPRTVRPSLEPISMPLIAMAAVHVVAGMIIFKLLVPEGFEPKSNPSSELLWMAPGQFTIEPMIDLPLIPPAIQAPKPAATQSNNSTLAAATDLPGFNEPLLPSATSVASTAKEADKYITLTPVTPAPARNSRRTPNGPVLSLMDIAGRIAAEKAGDVSGVDMGKIDRAVQETFMKEWVAPPVMGIPVTERSAHLEIAILKDGTVAGSKLVKPSGAEVLDASILDVAKRVTKIPVTLPSSFTKERYHLQVNFQIE